MCGVHHAAHHRGFLLIEGESEQDITFAHADGTPYGHAPRPADVQANTDARAALRSLGLTESETRGALAAARTHVGPVASTEELVVAALRRPAMPTRAA